MLLIRTGFFLSGFTTSVTVKIILHFAQQHLLTLRHPLLDGVPPFLRCPQALLSLEACIILPEQISQRAEEKGFHDEPWGKPGEQGAVLNE